MRGIAETTTANITAYCLLFIEIKANPSDASGVLSFYIGVRIDDRPTTPASSLTASEICGIR